MRGPFLLPALLSVAIGCGDEAPVQTPVDDNCQPSEGACNIEICAPETVEARHVDVCSVITWPTNPPTSGQHYPIWAAFKDYEAPVARGFWLHSVEHSGVVLAYNCEHAESCDELIDDLVGFAAAAEDDPLCDASVGNRLIVTPDPLLDVAFAAVAWGHSLKGSCFDETAVAAFVDEHYGKNYENFCSGGVDPTDPEEGYPDDCGAP